MVLPPRARKSSRAECVPSLTSCSLPGRLRKHGPASRAEKADPLLEANRDLIRVGNELAAQPEYIRDTRLAVFCAHAELGQGGLGGCEYRQHRNGQETQYRMDHLRAHGLSLLSRP